MIRFLFFLLFATVAWGQDARLLVDVNPTKAFASYPKNQLKYQVGVDAAGKNLQPELTTLSEPGYLDWKLKEYTLRKDMLNGIPVFKHMLKPGMAYRNDGTYFSGRSSILADWSISNPHTLKPGKPYWTALAFYLDPAAACDNMPLLGHGHAVTSKNMQGTLKLDLRENCNARLWFNSSNILDVQDDKLVKRTTYERGPLAKGVWHYFIFQFRLEWDPTKNPYTKSGMQWVTPPRSNG